MTQLTIEQIRRYIRINGDVIYVRHFDNLKNKWRSMSLNELTEQEQEEYIKKWHLEGRLPHILLESF